jgi:superfamily II DNA/RNA helicase
MIYEKQISFEDLKIPDLLIKGLYEKGYEFPSKIQLQALPYLLKRPFNFLL